VKLSILFGAVFVVAVVVVLPLGAIVGAVYAQYLMETRPPRGARPVEQLDREALPGFVPVSLA
jgi:ABC-type uncharacterized transport system permease subunit